ncbi:unnamed protein product [Moneuplotes crassus]|uniref:C2H2-type domain-containing protein n=1 Tax=Euplotes crassus TaxID=5936 RepID=A0AAD1UBU5_EUPCR|nr:unnamed protein product [Moneuplotes crassus]
MEEDKEQRIHGVQTKVNKRKETQTSFIEELNDYKGHFSEFLSSQIQEAEKRVVHYKCKVDGCSKVFERAQNIAMHMRMHFNIKKYKCNYCQRRFIQKGNRDKHLKQHITPKLEERKVIPCSLCNGMFTEKHNLQFHMRQKHGIQNPFKQ